MSSKHKNVLQCLTTLEPKWIRSGRRCCHYQDFLCCSLDLLVLCQLSPHPPCGCNLGLTLQHAFRDK